MFLVIMRWSSDFSASYSVPKEDAPQQLLMQLSDLQYNTMLKDMFSTV